MRPTAVEIHICLPYMPMCCNIKEIKNVNPQEKIQSLNGLRKLTEQATDRTAKVEKILRWVHGIVFNKKKM